MLQAFLSQAILTPDETREGALLVEDGILRAICQWSELPPEAVVEDLRPLGTAAGPRRHPRPHQ